MSDLNATHDAGRRSFVAPANDAESDFPIQNLPFGVFRRDRTSEPRCGVAIGDHILDLAAVRAEGLLSGLAEEAAACTEGGTFGPLMARGNLPASALRAAVGAILDENSLERGSIMEHGTQILVPMDACTLDLPTDIRNFTDFFTSSFHAARMSPSGRVGDNFMSLPIAYHSRASSVCVSGTPVRRPHAQQRRNETTVFEPTRELDYELELAAFVGPGNMLGQPMAIDQAAKSIFGYCLLNDWSVRDQQFWEMMPLGPFLAKSLATTISPWIVTEEAMRPFGIQAFTREAGEPEPLPYLNSPSQASAGGLDLQLKALLLTDRMRADGAPPVCVTDTNFKHMYWTFAQMLTHHMSNGCNLLPGDLLGSGTVSGPTDESRACLAEINERGKRPVALPNGESRLWLQDGDEVILTARAVRPGFASIGFGASRARITPALAWPAA